MLDLLFAAAGSLVTVALAAAAAAARALTPSAAAVAGVFGVAIVSFAGFGFLALLVVFVLVSSLATRFRFEEKRRRQVQEGTAGERGVSNVIAHIILPTAVAVGAGLSWISASSAAVLFGAALSFALADTLASEFGVLSGSARSILSLKVVVAGTNGGISAVGEGFALVGAFGVALVGAAAFALSGTSFGTPEAFFLAVGLAGFLGCQVDSVLGETLENRGILTKGSTNFLGMLASIVLAGLLLTATGAGL